jgi:mannose-6-phosphate isomerase-like protein (cupin superfamily)
MENLDRRNLFTAFSAFTALAASGGAATALTGPLTTQQLGKSMVIKYSELTVRTFPNGGTQRRVMSGILPTGEFIEVHESMLPAGQMPHPAHKHPNTEWLFIQSGELEYLDNGKVIPVGPNDIVFSATNVTHGLKNIGTTPANYIVFSVSKQLPE